MAEDYPRSFGNYTLLEPLAKGGMGSLYLACLGEAGMEKLCVVKTVLRELADKEYVARFRDEAKTVVRLSHGNVVPVFDAGTVDGELYIAMDFVDGKDLRTVWNRCAKKQIAFPVDVAAHIVRELSRGLHHAHTSGDLKLVHRDVSPPNVLLAFSGEVKLTDFGLASSTLKMERTAPGVIYGKVSYMSPEQARGDVLDGRTDQFAAGVILWELLTGRQLFPTGQGDALERVREAKIDPPSARATRVKPELDAIVLRALARDPGARYADCEGMRAALAQYLAVTAPSTDAARIAAFLRELFGEEIAADRARREKLVEQARAFREARPPARPAVPEERPRRRTPRPLSDTPLGEVEVDPEKGGSARVLGCLLDGRYKVNRLIGEGGMGRVYEAEHVEIGKRVAVKVLHPTYSRNAEAVARFRREARAASKIGHPNIVDVTDSGATDDGAVYFVMEYLEGTDLADLLAREGTLSVERSVNVGIQLARALDAAHRAGIVHRDLKPENIFLVSRPGQPEFVKVLDFGIAQTIEPSARQGQRRLTNPGMAMGTPEYMAPEQANGQESDGRADIYAAGAILYEMIAGTPPHTGANFMEVLSKKANDVPRPLGDVREGVTRELSQVISCALERQIEKRPQTMESLARALERCRPDRRARRGEGGPAEAPEIVVHPGSGPQVVGEVSREVTRPEGRAVWAALAMASVAVAVAASLAIWKATRPLPPDEKKVAQSASRRAALPQAAAVVPASPAPSPETKPAERPRASEERKGRERRPVAHAATGSGLADAHRLLANNELDAAERAFQALARTGVDRGAVATGLARVAFERGEFGEAIRRGQRAVVSGGGWPAHLVLGNAYFKVNQFDAAQREYRAVLKARPDSSEAKQNLEAALRRAGR